MSIFVRQCRSWESVLEPRTVAIYPAHVSHLRSWMMYQRLTLTPRIWTVHNKIMESNQSKPEEPNTQKFCGLSILLHHVQLNRMC